MQLLFEGLDLLFNFHLLFLQILNIMLGGLFSCVYDLLDWLHLSQVCFVVREFFAPFLLFFFQLDKDVWLFWGLLFEKLLLTEIDFEGVFEWVDLLLMRDELLFDFRLFKADIFSFFVDDWVYFLKFLIDFFELRFHLLEILCLLRKDLLVMHVVLYHFLKLCFCILNFLLEFSKVSGLVLDLGLSLEIFLLISFKFFG